MKSCLIVAAAETCGFMDVMPHYDFLICADGGSINAKILGLSPDIVIGDNDSGNDCEIILPKIKDVTDLEAAINIGISKGYSDFIIFGATGGRLDHFLSGLFLLEGLMQKNVTAKIIDTQNEIFMYSHGLKLCPPHKFQYFSIIPVDEKLEGVCIKNAEFELDNAIVYRSNSLTVSNEPISGKTTAIFIKTGRAIIVLSKNKSA